MPHEVTSRWYSKGGSPLDGISSNFKRVWLNLPELCIFNGCDRPSGLDDFMVPLHYELDGELHLHPPPALLLGPRNLVSLVHLA